MQVSSNPLSRIQEVWKKGGLGRFAILGVVFVALVGICLFCTICFIGISSGTQTSTPTSAPPRLAVTSTASDDTKTSTSTITATPTVTPTSTVKATSPVVVPATIIPSTSIPTLIIVPTDTPAPIPTEAPTAAARVRTGAQCNDGTTSGATGSGACSSHGGVKCWFYSDGTCTKP